MMRPTTLLMRFGLAVVATFLAATSALGQGRVYSTNADFDLGALFNVNHDTDDQLELNTGTFQTLPNLWIANAGEDTLSRFDTTQIGASPGREVARYRTWFAGAHLNNPFAGPAPSRSAVDADGNCYILNRHFDGRQASLLKVLATGGVDRNGNGTIETSGDLNSNGTIDAAEIIPLVDSNGNGQLDDAELADERVAWIRHIGNPAGLGRSLSIDPSGFIWVGLYSQGAYFKLDSAGSTVAGPIATPSHTPYGSVVDANGTLWGASLALNLLELNTNTNAFVARRAHAGGFDYGIAIGNGVVYKAGDYGAPPFIRYNPATTTFDFPNPSGNDGLGIGVDSAGNIVVSGGGGNFRAGCTKYSPSGAVIWSSGPQAGATSSDVRGCIPDANGDIWVVNLNDNRISKYKGTDGSPLGTLPTGNRPYTYSDASGSSLFGQGIQRGTWTVVQDAGAADRDWGCVDCTKDIPADTAMKVEVRAANAVANLGSQNFVQVQDGDVFCGTGITGRFLECKITLDRTDPAATNTPVLFDIAIRTCGPTNLVARKKLTKVQLTWSKLGGATAYNIYRSTVSGGPYAQIGSSTTGTYLDSGLAPGTYFYVCRATNVDESCDSNQVSVTLP